MPLNMPQDLAWAAMRATPIPDLFQRYGGFPDGVRVEESSVTMPNLPGIGFGGSRN
jgi:hypothetical protein